MPASWLPSPMATLSAWIFGLGLLGTELVLQRTWRSLPLYRRHLGLFACALGASLLLRGPVPSALGADAAWAALGLALPSLLWLRGRHLLGLSYVRGQASRPDPSRPLILVADPHWGDTLTGLSEAAEAHPEADWLFLGDLFEVWVGLPGLAEPNQEAFLAWVAERRAAGRWVGLWTGNREYFLDGLAPRFDLLGEGTGGLLKDEGLAWEHGDLIDGRLWAYRLMFILFRSGPMWLFARWAPSRISRAVAARLRRKFAARPGAYEYPVPMEALETAAFSSGGRSFVVGHFHHEAQVGMAQALPWAHHGAFWVWRKGVLSTLGPSSRP